MKKENLLLSDKKNKGDNTGFKDIEKLNKCINLLNPLALRKFCNDADHNDLLTKVYDVISDIIMRTTIIGNPQHSPYEFIQMKKLIVSSDAGLRYR